MQNEEQIGHLEPVTSVAIKLKFMYRPAPTKHSSGTKFCNHHLDQLNIKKILKYLGWTNKFAL